MKKCKFCKGWSLKGADMCSECYAKLKIMRSHGTIWRRSETKVKKEGK